MTTWLSGADKHPLDALRQDYRRVQREMDQLLIQVLRIEANARVAPVPHGCCRGGAADIELPCQEPEEGSPA